jgi:hypothetical protein
VAVRCTRTDGYSDCVAIGAVLDGIAQQVVDHAPQVADTQKAENFVRARLDEQVWVWGFPVGPRLRHDVIVHYDPVGFAEMPRTQLRAGQCAIVRIAWTLSPRLRESFVSAGFGVDSNRTSGVAKIRMCVAADTSAHRGAQDQVARALR